jgi:hypothetical protein
MTSSSDESFVVIEETSNALLDEDDDVVNKEDDDEAFVLIATKAPMYHTQNQNNSGDHTFKNTERSYSECVGADDLVRDDYDEASFPKIVPTHLKRDFVTALEQQQEASPASQGSGTEKLSFLKTVSQKQMRFDSIGIEDDHDCLMLETQPKFAEPSKLPPKILYCCYYC